MSEGNGGSGPEKADSPLASFVMAVSMIAVSEIGDKTFLIAALMAMRHKRWLVFSSAASSLAIMTILSGIVGHASVAFISERYTRFLAGLLFLVFGYKLTLEGLEMRKDAGVREEMAEVEEEIAACSNGDIEMGDYHKNSSPKASDSSVLAPIQSLFRQIVHKASLLVSPIWINIFIMIFLGEFGDRSQISIVAMASDSDYWYVIAGAVLGHFVCTFIAVLGGKFLATKISMRTVTLGGAFSFFIFAIWYIYEAFTTE
ncbi:hypothetical protein HG535_0A05780 [Zygotorulaspora mrakii]|uniref:GDT1 family protein n=1 Tax=Zygotorulaspora mrakii TaxID=42260 RepID=A0A7H9AWW8_ZYGMR|nr:uncharacterized protein HG535_0A05780 [Zygotorulaspora mrakii]QLG70637.1 hypothetical protein HG535_0A05780 [Zygotorulaspora mrakii]